MPLQDITITASINSLATQSYDQKTYIASTDEQSYPIIRITGSSGGVWPNFVKNTNYTIDLITNVTQSWSGSNTTPTGSVPFVHNTMEEFINGEFSGSNIIVSNGNLTDDHCLTFLTANTKSADYSIFPYITVYNINSQLIEYNAFPEFIHRYTIPNKGQMLIYVYQTKDPDVIPTYYTGQIVYAKISRIDQEGNDNTPSLQELKEIIWVDGSLGKIILTVTNITEYQDYYYYTISSQTWNNTISSFISDDNYLDYDLIATSSWNDLKIGYNYLTSSWTTSKDDAWGFNTSSGQYVFPLTPNCSIYLTASVKITVSTSCSFSLAINAYDPINPSGYQYAVDSINATLSSSINSYILTPGITNSIFVTSSVYNPIQNYRYEIDAWLDVQEVENINYAINGNWEWTDPFTNSKNQYLPDSPGIGAGGEWVSRVGDGDISSPYTYDPNQSGWNAIGDFDYWFKTGSTSYGVVFVPEAKTTGSILQYFDPGGLSAIPWIENSYYTVIVNIPATFTTSRNDYGEGPPFYGPPSSDVDITINSDNPYDLTYYIGTIPSGAYGTFNFPVFITDLSTQNTINFVTPLAATNQFNVGARSGSFFTISSIEISSSLTASLHEIAFRITQSQIPQLSTSSVILEPYLSDLFYNTDCDVLMNNYSQNETSEYVRRVLYSNGGIIPSNLEEIINRTAEFAEVNDYIYTANANVLPRYNGVRTTSRDVNSSFVANGFNSTQLSEFDPVSITSRTLPNVENTTTYFAYFSSLKSNSPLLKDTTSPVLKYLIGEDGTTYNPASDNITYYNIVGSFPVDSKVTCNLLYESSPVFNSTQSITLSGESYTPILYTIEDFTDSTISWSDKMEFTNLQGTNINGTNYDTRLENGDGAPFSYINSYSARNVFWSTNLNDDRYDISYNEGGTITPDIGAERVYFEFTGNPTNFIDIQAGANYWDDPSGGRTYILTVALRRGGTDTILGQTSGTTLSSDGFKTIIVPNFAPQPGDKIFFEVYNGGQYTMYKRPGSPAPYLQIITKNLNAPSASLAGGNFWSTGSNSLSVLTSSIELGKVLSINNKQIDIEASALPPIQYSCLPKVGDEIRFDYDEDNTYKIINVNPTSSGVNRITYLTLDNPIPASGSGFDINRFLIRRKVKDAITGVIIDANLSNLTIEDGFLLPEYPSKTIQNNISSIITNLINNSVI